jgi:ribosomal protein L40E
MPDNPLKPPVNAGPWWSPLQVTAWLEILLHAYHSGNITETEAHNLLKLFYFHDSPGNLWTIGSETGKWYRYEANRWVMQSPPQLVASIYTSDEFIDIAKPAFESQVTSSRQSSQTLGIQCRQCGTRLPDNMEQCLICGFSLKPKAEMVKGSQTRPDEQANVAVCQNCGASNVGRVNRCLRCGAEIKGLPAITGRADAKSPVAQTQVRCSSCNALVDSSAKFCGECGANIKAMTGLCPKCGKQNKPNSAFCIECGTRLR